MDGQKTDLMILSQESYGLYPARNIMFKVNNNNGGIMKEFIDTLSICLPD